MRIRYALLPLLGISLLLISATSIEKKENPVAAKSEAVTTSIISSRVVTHKQNFFQRLLIKLFVRKGKQKDNSSADNLALTSLLLGIAACVSLLIGLVVPYLVFASIPFGIAAMITGSSAIKQGTNNKTKAKLGKGLGLGAIISITVLVIIAAIVVASGGLNFNWN